MDHFDSHPQPLMPPLTSARLYLRYYSPDDLPAIYPLFRDLSTLEWYLHLLPRPLTEEQTAEMLKTWHDGDRYMLFSIVNKATDKVIGLINFDDIDWTNRYSEVGIGLAAPGVRGKGLALEAMGLLIRYAFDEMDLERLFARVIDGNESSLKLFERAGFQEEGRLREHIYRHGKRRDMHLLGLLKKDWRSASAN